MSIHVTKRKAKNFFLTSTNHLIIKDSIIYSSRINVMYSCWDEKGNYIGDMGIELILEENFDLLTY